MDRKAIQMTVLLDIEDEHLSCKSTFWDKFIWAPFVIFGYWPIALAFAWSRLDWQGLVMLAIPWSIVSVYFYCTLIRLKKITISGSKLIVSNYRKEISIDLSDIDSAGGSVFLNPELVWINLKKETEFGKRIIFAPKQRSTFNICTGLTKHPLVAKLNSVCSIAEELSI